VLDLVNEQGEVLRRHLAPQEDDPVDQEEPAHNPVGQHSAHGTERQTQDASLGHDLGPDLARTDGEHQGDGGGHDRGDREDAAAGHVEHVDHDCAQGRTRSESERAARREDTHRQAEPARRSDIADRGHHHSGVAQLECDEHHADDELPGLAACGHHGEDAHLDERAADDHRLAAVLVRPDAPKRDERESSEEEEGAEQSDETVDIGRRHAHFLQPVRQEGVHLGNAVALDERGDPVQGEQ
jgi:hypothetical protein